MTDFLAKLGLTKDFVRSSLGTTDESIPIEEKNRNYLDVLDQRRIRRRLKEYSKFIIARYAEGYDPTKIALFLNVSEESIRSRLRKAGLFNSEGPGRPKKIQKPTSAL
jgi:DNA-directed RNA polymerase specialized sigma24 family protein|tara:strand:+ start:9 stop:332 length:324 start_codon:yes stop_codon:yes gene_type:complete